MCVCIYIDLYIHRNTFFPFPFKESSFSKVEVLFHREVPRSSSKWGMAVDKETWGWMLVNSKKGVSWRCSCRTPCSVLRAQVQSLIRELGSCKPHGTAKERKGVVIFFCSLWLDRVLRQFWAAGCCRSLTWWLKHLFVGVGLSSAVFLLCRVSTSREGMRSEQSGDAEAPTLEKVSVLEVPRSVMDIVGTEINFCCIKSHHTNTQKWEERWFTMLCIFLLGNKVIQLYLYIYVYTLSLYIFLSVML